MAKTQKGGTKSRKLRKTLKNSNMTTNSYMDANSVILIWINKTIKPTIYNGLSYDVMLEKIPLVKWVEYKKTHDKNFDIYFFYDSKMISASHDEIMEFISPISEDVIFVDIRSKLLDWVYANIVKIIKMRYMPTEYEYENKHINDFLNEYLIENIKRNTDYFSDDNKFSGKIDYLSVPDNIYEIMKNIGLYNFMYSILFSEKTPIYFRVDIIRVMAQIYLFSEPNTKYILTIDVDISPDDNKLLDYMFNKPKSGFSAIPKFIRNILIKSGLTMFNSENSMTLLNTELGNNKELFYEIWFIILIIHPLLTYFGFLKYPGYYNFQGVQRGITSYSKLVCVAFSQIVYKNYQYFSYWFTKLLQFTIENNFASNEYNLISYASEMSPLTRDFYNYFGRMNYKDKELNPIKRININKEYLNMPISQFNVGNPCFED